MGILRFLFKALTTSNSKPVRLRRTAPHARKPANQTTKAFPNQAKVQERLPVFPEIGELRGKCHVIDGDTIVIKRTKIRLAGIDAPELDKPWGQKSKWAMIALCKGQEVTAKLTGERSHDRLVAICFLPDGRDIGAELIKQGLALDWSRFSGGKYHHLEPRGVRRKLRGAHHR